MTHPIHAAIEAAFIILLCAALVIPAAFVAFWAVIGAWRSVFSGAENVPDMLTEEQKELHALPMGAPRDGGSYIYTGEGWERLNDEEAAEVRQNLKYIAKAKEAKRDPEGWQHLAPETAVHHPEHSLELLNDIDGDYDGPDDVEEEEAEIPAV